MNNAKDRMTKAVQAYTRNLATIRAGRANASLLDRITVEYYGVPTPINQIASYFCSRGKNVSHSTL